MRIELFDVRTSLAGRPVLRGLDLTVADGELLALLGPSGAGKSTLLAVLAGFQAHTGEVRFDGRSMAGVEPRRRGLGMVFQDLALWPHLTVEGHLAFVLEAAGVAPGERRARIGALLEQLELGALAGRRPAQLSGGEAQRLALARALVAQPRALLLDEPLGALDRSLRERMLGLVGDVHARSGATTILVTHDYDEAMVLARRVAVLDAGEILQCGAPAAVYRRPASARVARATGQVSLVPARREGGTVVLSFGAARAEFAPGAPVDEVAVALRPEDVRVLPGVGGRVRSSGYRGGRWLAEVELGGQVVTGWSAECLAPGTAVALELAQPVWAVG